MEKTLDILKKSPLFSGIAENNLSPMLNCLSIRKAVYAKDAYILSAESPVTDVGIVLSGSVNVIKEDFWGNRAILAKMKSGEIFAEAFSFALVRKLPVSVVAAEKVEILFVDFKKITTTCPSACDFHTQLIQNILKLLAQKNIMLTQKLEHIVKRTTREKLLSYLSEQAKQAGGNSFSIPFNRQELADYLSVDRSAMSNELCKLRDEGILEFSKNHFVLTKV
ncbi:Crp/Fnr family transcriptional regulator [Acetivibrio cellulolyticus]|uniref:Crp/Fnr family transcriptional regulator n=1 Tax=Acetivibrio cellulolyticus TaxID=35830 RepID=UPI0001E2E6D2|nr:Crp/Fnr family transcriptional regulator [Acetivibrio cellulolyticus]